jgi:hypothetical protein
VWNIYNIQTNTLATYVWKKQIKYWEYKLTTYVYNHCNIYNIPIHFCNIRMKNLQYTSKTSETLETYACNMRFQRNISLLLRRTEACRRVEFTWGSGPRRGVEKMAPTSSSRRWQTDLGTRAASGPRLPPWVQRASGPQREGASVDRKAGRPIFFFEKLPSGYEEVVGLASETDGHPLPSITVSGEVICCWRC